MFPGTLTHHDILKLCQVPKYPRVFLLPTLERPSRVFSQQRRALNLVHALFEVGAIGERGLIVIGAGFGGLTAGAYAAMQGAPVTILEEQGELLGRFNQSERFLHPRMYDWPRDGWDNHRCGLPTLDWNADLAKNVRAHVVQQVEGIKNAFRLKIICNRTAGAIYSDFDGVCVASKSRDPNADKNDDLIEGDALIVAAGFGPERALGGYDAAKFPKYWEAVPTLGWNPGKESEILVVGNGDGALADLIGFAHGLEPDATKNAVSGDFTGLLKRIEGERRAILKLEEEVRDRLAAGNSEFPEYESRITEILRPKLPQPNPNWPRISIEAKKSSVLDLAGTYAANRALFIYYFGGGNKFQFHARERKVLPSTPRSAKGPFVHLGENTWSLVRSGPEDPLKSRLPDLRNKLAGTQNLRQLELSERAVSRAAWSRQVVWGPRNEPDERPMPRISLATEWTDSYVQVVLAKSLGELKAAQILRGLLRIYAEISHEVLLTDAAVLDGKILMPAIRDCPRLVEKLIVMTRCINPDAKPDLLAAAALFLAQKKAQIWIGRKVELSFLGGKQSPLHSLEFQAGSPLELIERLREIPELEAFVEQAKAAAQMLNRKTRPIPNNLPSLRIWEPQSGLAESLLPLALPGRLLPARARTEAPNRSDVFKQLRLAAGTSDEGDVLTLDTPRWLPHVAGWFNAAYNTTIAHRNGANSVDVFWADPMLNHQDETHLRRTIELDVLKIGAYSSHEWNRLAEDLQPGIHQWREGRTLLPDALASLPGSTIQENRPLAPRESLAKRLRLTDQGGWRLTFAEFNNSVHDYFSPRNAICVAACDQLLSTLLIA